MACLIAIRQNEFAENYSEKALKFWEKAIWSDKTMVRSLPKSIEIFVKTSDWRKKMAQNQIQNGGFGVILVSVPLSQFKNL